MGNTPPMASVMPKIEDHPHIHGEYCKGNVVDPLCQGSPPHTWGILAGFNPSVVQFRITPTYMGNTDDNDLQELAVEDHPHIHGEYLILPTVMTVVWGSPPHTWGILVATKYGLDAKRITPTYMGNNNRPYQYQWLGEDHPHIHGEYIGLDLTHVSGSGSPPHTWGIRFPYHCH